MPAWIGGSEADTTQVAFNNGLLDLDRNRLVDHNPLWFSPICLPYDFSPSATCLRWLAFLNEVFERDPERIMLLQEWFGYCLTADTSFQKCMLFYGVPGAGKGTMAEILKRVLGAENTSNVRLELMGERFQLAETEGKLLNIADEVVQGMKFHEGVFKSFTAGEPVRIERKGHDSITAPPTARLLMLGNEHLPFKDMSGAIERRLLLLKFNKVPSKEDLDLKDKLSEELSGIFNWALEGRQRLYQNSKFTVTQVGNKEKKDMTRSNNHLLSWAEDLGAYDPACGLEDSRPSKDVYIHYKEWCDEHGIPHHQRDAEPNLARKARISLGLPSDWEPKRRATGDRSRVWPGFRFPRPANEYA